MQRHSRSRPPETVCLAAILKDEESFVEEWVAHHRLLGVDHFFLYDNDPLQPLQDILRLHRDYVTIRPWLVEHDDPNYPGHTKQLKAYRHCLDNGAANYDWVTFLDGDEFIILNEHEHLQAFLADFQDCDLVALNWHVFGHDGHFDDPPGLVLESLTRRMKEPRAMTKTLCRPDAVARLAVHLSQVKKGRRRVDANKISFRDDLYPGKTRRAHINHYQCRSFTQWMRKARRGEVGVFASDPENEWRFSEEGCLRQFVTVIARDKNEFVDISAARYVGAIKAYLRDLREAGGDQALGGNPAAHPAVAIAAFEPQAAIKPHSATVTVGPAPKGIAGFLLARLGRWKQRVATLKRPRLKRTDAVKLAEAKQASERKDWPRAEILWQEVLERKPDAPAVYYQRLARACRHQGNFRKALDIVRQGLLRYPEHLELNLNLTEIAIAERDWPLASTSAGKILKIFEREPKRIADKHLTLALEAVLGNREYARTYAAVNAARASGRNGRSLLAIEGLAHLRSSRIEEARRHWDDYWQRAQNDAQFAAEHYATRPYDDPRNAVDFPALQPVPNAVLAEQRICVYTGLFGGYDELHPPAYKPPGLEFICFSDRPFTANGWEVRVIDLPGGSGAMKNRQVKLLPFDFLPDYDGSLYIDSNLVLLGDPSLLYRQWLRGQSFVAWRHPQRCSIFDELSVILASSRAEPSRIIDQYVHFAEQSVPERVPMIEANFLWRDHRDRRLQRFMQQVWEHLVRFQSWRDQPAIAYLMWKTGFQPAIMPDRLGTSRDNEFAHKFIHKSSKQTTPSPTQRLGSRRLVWVYSDKLRATASTVMRGYQLADIARNHFAGKVEAYVVNEARLEEQRDALVVLTKGFLKRASVDDLERLKRSGNIVCADYVDNPERPELHELIDIYIAASIRQYIHFVDTYADKAVRLLSHHADPRLAGTTGPDDYCNVGYFGEIINARYAAELQGKIDFCLVDTKLADTGWLQRLRHCNVHYAVRNRRPIDGFKPFLKGFTAAHCRSNIIVPRREGDAIYYLTSDYPYLLEDDGFNSVLYMIDRVKASFGSDEWRQGLEIMESVRRRSSLEQVSSEIGALVNCYG